jgi:hypothetical protein
VALAAATWGVLLRWAAAAAAITTIAATALALALANHQGKPSGFGELWASGDPPPPPVHSVWDEPRWSVQTWLRPGDDREDVLFRFVDEQLPDDADVAVAPRENDFLSPYFGSHLSRHVSLVPDDGRGVPPDADWLVLSPGSSVAHCRGSWRTELALDSGWRVERRTAPDACPEAEKKS